MPKEEWGTKRLCPTTGKRFYDLNKSPIVSPYTGEVVEFDESKNRMIAADAEDNATKKATRICWMTMTTKTTMSRSTNWRTWRRTTTTDTVTGHVRGAGFFA